MQKMSGDMLVIRGATGSLIFLEALAAVPLGICVVLATRSTAGVLSGGIVLSSMCFVALWVKCYVVRILNGRLECRRFLGRPRGINLINIEAASLEVGRRGYADRFRPPFRLAIEPHKRGSEEGFDINLRVFSREDVERLIYVLSEINRIPINGKGKTPR